MKRTRLALFSALLLAVGLAAGCVVDVDDHGHGPGVFLADLQVDWRIQGSQSTSFCDAYGIDHWIVRVNGPEVREAVVDCRAHYWSSENDFLALTEGSYDISVKAIGPAGYVLARQDTFVEVLDLGYTDVLTFQFRGSDF
jgi:hypothetical protein